MGETGTNSRKMRSKKSERRSENPLERRNSERKKQSGQSQSGEAL